MALKAAYPTGKPSRKRANASGRTAANQHKLPNHITVSRFSMNIISRIFHGYACKIWQLVYIYSHAHILYKLKIIGT
jgi:hypothetical protein